MEGTFIEGDLNFDKKDCILCCCRHDVPHDESLKFIIKASEQNLQLTPFKNAP